MKDNPECSECYDCSGEISTEGGFRIACPNCVGYLDRNGKTVYLKSDKDSNDWSRKELK